MNKRIKIGVAGAGHLGKIHLKCLRELDEIFDLRGLFDPDARAASEASQQFQCLAFGSLEEMMEDCDAIDIVCPTSAHYATAVAAIKSLRHVFVEKPVTSTSEEARTLLKLEREAGVKIQVGHVERFNPAFIAAREHLNKPRFIETHRLAQFNPRGTDVSVVLDLMIHDIDIVLSVTGANVRRILASGVSVLSESPDIANARIELDDGSVANLTASRISMKRMRKSRFFQRDAYIAVDFLEKTTEIVTLHPVEEQPDPFAIIIETGSAGVKKELRVQKPVSADSNAIKEELASFGNSIQTGGAVAVSLRDGTRALEVALQVLEKMKQHTLLQDPEVDIEPL